MILSRRIPSRHIRLLGAALPIVCLLALGGPGSTWAQADGEFLAPPPSVDEAVGTAARSGVLLVRRGAYAEAIQLLEPYRDTDHFTVLHALGVAYVRVNRNQEAYDLLLRAHALRPTIAAPLLPAALACAKMARTCTAYRALALEYTQRGGQLVRFAEKIANHQPKTLALRRF